MSKDEEWLGIWDYEGECEGLVRVLIENPNDSENTLILAVSKGGRLIVAVSDERAVDSYSSTFVCSIHIPPKLVPQIVEFLTKAFPQSQRTISNDEMNDFRRGKAGNGKARRGQAGHSKARRT